MQKDTETVIKTEKVIKREIIDHRTFEHSLRKLTFEKESGEKRTEDYLFTRGALVWPRKRKGLSGIILMAGRREDKVIVVLEEKVFETVQKAAEIFNDLWERFLPYRYYGKGSNYALVDTEFISELLRLIDREKLPIAAPNVDTDHGMQLVDSYLDQDNLRFPQGGILATQLEKKREDLDELYAIEALRYLLVGILNDPQKPEEVDETNILHKDVAELAEREKNKIWRGVNDEDEFF